jgi:hypothetical protein
LKQQEKNQPKLPETPKALKFTVGNLFVLDQKERFQKEHPDV